MMSNWASSAVFFISPASSARWPQITDVLACGKFRKRSSRSYRAVRMPSTPSTGMAAASAVTRKLGMADPGEESGGGRGRARSGERRGADATGS